MTKIKQNAVEQGNETYIQHCADVKQSCTDCSINIGSVLSRNYYFGSSVGNSDYFEGLATEESWLSAR